MASWNDLREGDEQDTCPICCAKLSKKRRTNHVTNCYDTNKNILDKKGLIKCPLYRLHIMPKRFLNFHLDGNCEEAQNLLRQYFQKTELGQKVKFPPPDFLADVPEELLNESSKKLLYILRRDLQGNPIFVTDEETDQKPTIPKREGIKQDS